MTVRKTVPLLINQYSMVPARLSFSLPITVARAFKSFSFLTFVKPFVIEPNVTAQKRHSF
jgi:hypothetical protein